MKLSIENADLANSKLAPRPPTKNDSSNYIKDYEKYRWYVGHAVYSFEAIFDVLPNDEEWKLTAKAFIEDHKAYINSDSFPCYRYSGEIQLLVKETLGDSACREKLRQINMSLH
jgi:hypothetical protein